MNGPCEEFDRRLDADVLDGESATRLGEHLRTCARCREQATADAALREAYFAPPPDLSADFEARLRRRLAARPAPEGRRPAWNWTLAAYVTAATCASIVILSRLPWQTLEAPRFMGFVLAVLALLSPLLLLDRVGVLRPPG